MNVPINSLLFFGVLVLLSNCKPSAPISLFQQNELTAFYGEDLMYSLSECKNKETLDGDTTYNNVHIIYYACLSAAWGQPYILAIYKSHYLTHINAHPFYFYEDSLNVINKGFNYVSPDSLMIEKVFGASPPSKFVSYYLQHGGDNSLENIAALYSLIYSGTVMDTSIKEEKHITFLERIETQEQYHQILKKMNGKPVKLPLSSGFANRLVFYHTNYNYMVEYTLVDTIVSEHYYFPYKFPTPYHVL